MPQAGTHRNSSQVIEHKPRVARGSLGAIVRSFKAAVTKRAREELRWAGDVWQRNYFERVLRDEQEFADASAYIKGNIKRWGLVGNGAQRAAPLQGRSGVSWSHGIHRFTRTY